MLNFFAKTTPKDWTIAGALEEIQRTYPDGQRAYHLHLVKEELKSLCNHKNEAQRQQAQYLINNWEVPKQSHTNQTASTIINKARNQTNYQATYQTFNEVINNDE